MIIIAFSLDLEYKILWINDFSIPASTSKYQISMNKGQPFSLVYHSDPTYIWAVGRIVDNTNREYGFHHFRLKKDDYDMFELYYKVDSSPTSKYMLLHSDKKSNGDYLWSCGYHTDGSSEKAIYSLLTSARNLYAKRQIANSKCFGI